MANQVRVGVGVTGVRKAETDLDRMRDKFARLQKQGAKGFAIGAGAAITAGAFGLLAGAGSKVIDVLGDATEAARQDEVSQTKLRAALVANVDAFDGNTDAIEGVLASRMKLGFSDDEQRESLAQLVVATNDVNKALAIQRGAMDLARLKGISLAEAGQALIKVEGGQFRALKAMGIELRKGATTTEALAAVTKAAEGQAEEYAKTASGKMLTAQTLINEKMEKLGYVIMPVVADAMTDFVGILDPTSRTLDDLRKKADESNFLGFKTFLNDAAIQLEEVDNLSRELGTDAEVTWGLMAETGSKSVEVLRGALTRLNDRASETRFITGREFGRIGDAATDTAEENEDATEDIIDAWAKVVDSLRDGAQALIDDFFDPLEARADIRASRQELHAAEEAARLATTRSAHRDAAEDINESLRSQGEALLKLGDTGDLAKEDVLKFKRDTKAAYEVLGLRVPAELRKIFRALDTFETYDGGAISIGVRTGPLSSRHNQEGDIVGKAHGGPVSANTPYLVGEQGPEIVVPSSAGNVIPNGGIGGNTYNLNVIGNLRADDAMSAVRAMRRLESVALTPNTNGQR